MNRTRYINFLKHTVYCLLFFVLYIIQTVPGLFSVLDVKPVWVIPAAIVLAMFEGEFIGGLYGALAGLFCDMGSLLLFGFNGILTCVYCIAVGLLIIYLMRCNLLGAFLCVLVFMMIQGLLDFFFSYGMWNYDNVWRLYIRYTLPTAAYSTLITPLVFYPIRALHHKLIA